MVTCNKTRGYHSYKKMRVISKVSITGITLFLSRLQTLKQLQCWLYYFIIQGDGTTYDLQKT